MTTRDHPRDLYPDVAVGWTGPAATRVGINNPDAATTRWEWDIDLTAPQAALFDDTVAAAKAGLDVALYAGIKTDVKGLITFQSLASPTNAQVIAAVKAQSRILRVLVRD